jgi:peroxiredoxin Q/BCP
VKSHCSFRDKFGLTIPLLSDPDLAVHKAYGTYGKKKMYGRDVLGTIRTTFLIKDGLIARIFPSVKVDGHADAVLQAIGELAHGPSSRRIPTLRPPAKTTARKVVKKRAARVAKKTKTKKTAKKTTKKK